MFNIFFHGSVKIVYRCCDIKDLPAVIALEQKSIAEVWSDQQYRAHLAGNGVIFGAFSEGVLCGYLSLLAVPPEGDLCKIAVDPACRYRGIGTSLLQAGIDSCCLSRGIDTIFCEVRRSNGACLFYENMGFVIVGERKAYYHDGEDCILYRWRR
ncbi:MAG: GNAT family N-acetyltransferase [Fibrobacterota bacterium]